MLRVHGLCIIACRPETCTGVSKTRSCGEVLQSVPSVQLIIDRASLSKLRPGNVGLRMHAVSMLHINACHEEIKLGLVRSVIFSGPLHLIDVRSRRR